MSSLTLILLLVYIGACVLLWFTSGRAGILFALALNPLALAYALIGRFFGEQWRLVLVIPILLFGLLVAKQRRRGKKSDANDDI